MRLSDSVRRWIRLRATPRDAEAIRDLASSENPTVREAFAGMAEVLGDDLARTAQALARALMAVAGRRTGNAALADLKRELPAVTEVIGAHYHLQAFPLLKSLIRAYQRGPDAVMLWLVQHLTTATINGMLIERARRREHEAA